MSGSGRKNTPPQAASKNGTPPSTLPSPLHGIVSSVTNTMTGVNAYLFGADAKTPITSSETLPLHFGEFMTAGYSDAELNAEVGVLLNEIAEQKRRLARLVELNDELVELQKKSKELVHYQTLDGRTRYYSREILFNRANATKTHFENIFDKIKNILPTMAKWIVDYIVSRFKVDKERRVHELLPQIVKKSAIHIAQFKSLNNDAKQKLIKRFNPIVDANFSDAKELQVTADVKNNTNEFIKQRWMIADNAHALFDKITDNVLKAYVYFSPYTKTLEQSFLIAQSQWVQKPYSPINNEMKGEDNAHLSQARDKQLSVLLEAEEFVKNVKFALEAEEKTHALRNEAEAYCQRVEAEILESRLICMKAIVNLKTAMMGFIIEIMDRESLDSQLVCRKYVVLHNAIQKAATAILGWDQDSLIKRYAAGFESVGMGEYFNKDFLPNNMILAIVSGVNDSIRESQDVLSDVNNLNIVHAQLIKKFLSLTQAMVSKKNLEAVWNKKLTVSRYSVNGVMVQLGISKVHAVIHDKDLTNMSQVDAMVCYDRIKQEIQDRRSNTCFSWIREKLRDQDSAGVIYGMIDEMPAVDAANLTPQVLSTMCDKINKFETKLRKLNIDLGPSELVQMQLPNSEQSIKLR